jgi:hypothetical protein
MRKRIRVPRDYSTNRKIEDGWQGFGFDEVARLLHCKIRRPLLDDKRHCYYGSVEEEEKGEEGKEGGREGGRDWIIHIRDLPAPSCTPTHQAHAAL